MTSRREPGPRVRQTSDYPIPAGTAGTPTGWSVCRTSGYDGQDGSEAPRRRILELSATGEVEWRLVRADTEVSRWIQVAGERPRTFALPLGCQLAVRRPGGSSAPGDVTAVVSDGEAPSEA